MIEKHRSGLKDRDFDRFLTAISKHSCTQCEKIPPGESTEENFQFDPHPGM